MSYLEIQFSVPLNFQYLLSLLFDWTGGKLGFIRFSLFTPWRKWKLLEYGPHPQTCLQPNTKLSALCGFPGQTVHNGGILWLYYPSLLSRLSIKDSCPLLHTWCLCRSQTLTPFLKLLYWSSTPMISPYTDFYVQDLDLFFGGCLLLLYSGNSVQN